jgi:hypothetical protein
MGESQCLAFCGDGWKVREELPKESLLLKNDEGTNEKGFCK